MTQEDMRYVAGHGLVPWPAGRVTQHAQYVWSTHQADKALLELRWWQQHLPYLSVRRRRCTVCQTAWVCREAAWALVWLGSRDWGAVSDSWSWGELDEPQTEAAT